MLNACHFGPGCHDFRSEPFMLSLLYPCSRSDLASYSHLLRVMIWQPRRDNNRDHSRIYKFGLNTLPSKTIVIPYTCGLSRPFSGAVAGEHSYICCVTWDYYQFITMKNLKDATTKIFPSKT